ncbi:hypothetical protein THMIRHAS_03450 [Thiosulfatimonas sediminis]|uniref:Epimerase n=1 Tax=Thiosulfatimonas sediminis TaxID=2675054 RepID=A0A6F8PS62_9GAMM|nr:TIGR01777 family oxidoreductase [Thiosulfatimonas sediminis]BBP44972.1 hypothetical protein THMIRHAS_03450 [Thiosulfatimonas sediminis]
MKIAILGGTGLIGNALHTALQQEHQVSQHGRAVFANTSTLLSAIQNADLVVQLSGANIGERWRKGYKKILWDSRINTTRLLAQVLPECDKAPRIICASAIGFYPQTQNCTQPFSEQDKQAGDDFLAQLSVAWEAEAHKLTHAENLVITRFGVVLSPEGGALAKMLPPFKLGLGGPIAGGTQCFSWIDIDDLCAAMQFIIARPELNGTFNLTAPNPITQKQFAQTLGKTLKRPAFLPLPEWQLKLMFGEGAQVLTHSASVFPQRLIDLGFHFHYPDAASSLQHLLHK